MLVAILLMFCFWCVVDSVVLVTVFGFVWFGCLRWPIV